MYCHSTSTFYRRIPNGLSVLNYWRRDGPDVCEITGPLGRQVTLYLLAGVKSLESVGSRNGEPFFLGK